MTYIITYNNNTFTYDNIDDVCNKIQYAIYSNNNTIRYSIVTVEKNSNIIATLRRITMGSMEGVLIMDNSGNGYYLDPRDPLLGDEIKKTLYKILNYRSKKWIYGILLSIIIIGLGVSLYIKYKPN
jgi:hypothetical protein